MNSVKQLRYRSRGQALIGLIIALAIIASVIAFMYGGGTRTGNVYSNSIQRANMTACGEYTSQIRQAIMMYRQDYGHNPPSLDALSKYGVTAEMYNSPGCVYGYDSASGRLSAPGGPGQGAGPGASAAYDEGGEGRRRDLNSQPAPPPVVVGNGGPQTSSPAPAPAAPSGPPANTSGPSTTVVGPGGMPIHVPTGP